MSTIDYLQSTHAGEPILARQSLVYYGFYGAQDNEILPAEDFGKTVQDGFSSTRFTDVIQNALFDLVDARC